MNYRDVMEECAEYICAHLEENLTALRLARRRVTRYIIFVTYFARISICPLENISVVAAWKVPLETLSMAKL